MDSRVMARHQGSSGAAWINVLLGIWVIISPFVLGFALLPRAMWNNAIAGIIVAALALTRTGSPQQSGWSWANVILGIWLIISPFVVTAFSQLMNFRANNIILGILVGLVALFRASGAARGQWSWANVALGIWLIISPFVLGVSSNVTAVWHNVIIGIVVALLALSRVSFRHPVATTSP